MKSLLLSKEDTSLVPVTTHNICELASFTNSPQLVTAARKLHSIVGMTARMRYPDCLPSPKTPRDAHTLEMALNVYGIVDESLRLIRQSIRVPLDDSFD